MTLIDLVGSIGVFLILLAYFLNVTGKIKSDSFLFIFFNLVGAMLACLASILLNYLPFIILEGAWVLVSIYALVRLLRNK